MSMVFTKVLKGCIGLALLALIACLWLLFSKTVEAPLRQDLSPAKTTTRTTIDPHYESLPVAITANPSVQSLIAQDPGRVQLVNFFSYACHGCARWRPFIDAWSKKHASEIAVYHIPILYNKAWEPFARIYYIAKALQKNEALDALLFKTIQERELDLSDKKTLGAFFEKQGVAPKTFEDLYDSFSVGQELIKAQNLATAYQITQSPSIILNTPRGSYLITPLMIEQGSGERLMETLDKLLVSTKGA